MVREIKARVSHGKIEPLEDVELPEGEEVTILLEDISTKSTNHNRFLRAAGGWEGLLDFDEFLKDLQESRKQIRPPVDLGL